ncbi:MAG: META domain-containing protein [Hyphomonadaceae bacterium]|nr:META domain-containing protein [Hyphomonadaceae bacterium]
MTRSTMAFGAAILAMALAACASTPPKAPPAAEATAPRADLSATSWRLETLDGAPPVDGSSPTLAFGTDGRVSGTTGCNRYFGAYSAETGFGQMGSTRMACPGPLMQQERTFFDIFRGASNVMIDSDNLLVVTGTDGRRAVFAAASTGS